MRRDQHCRAGVSGSFFGDELFVFEGDCTCCFRKHDGMKCETSTYVLQGMTLLQPEPNVASFGVSSNLWAPTLPSTGDLLIYSLLICVPLHVAEMLQISNIFPNMRSLTFGRDAIDF